MPFKNKEHVWVRWWLICNRQAAFSLVIQTQVLTFVAITLQTQYNPCATNSQEQLFHPYKQSLTSNCHVETKNNIEFKLDFMQSKITKTQLKGLVMGGYAPHRKSSRDAFKEKVRSILIQSTAKRFCAGRVCSPYKFFQVCSKRKWCPSSFLHT